MVQLLQAVQLLQGVQLLQQVQKDQEVQKLQQDQIPPEVQLHQVHLQHHLAQEDQQVP